MKELATLFLKLGMSAFGGPAAHIALMEDEVVRRRAWFNRQEFLDLLGIASLLPGPSSTELAILIGYKREGWRGLVLAGMCFILPAMLIVWGLARFYVEMGSLPVTFGSLYGIKAVIIAIIAQAILGLGHTALKSVPLGLIAGVALILFLAGTQALVVILGGGLISLIVDHLSSLRTFSRRSKIWLLWATMGFDGVNSFAALSQKVPPPVPLTQLFLFFVKLGSVVFGSGYVLLAFLQADLVDRWHWLTQAQLMDAVAVGQFTPGPVFTTATFIGYLLAGNEGAILATLGIFLPAFLLVSVSGLIVPRIRRSEKAKSFLNGINASSLALMVGASVELGRSALIDTTTITLAVASFILMQKFRTNSLWLIICGAVIGYWVNSNY